ncbi:MAG: heavy metal translocating P-type ATPase [Reinekea sp.]
MTSNTCFHCGLPNTGRPLELSINGETKYFCCQGCQSAAQTIIESGLGEYYRFHQPDQLPVTTALTDRQKQALAIYDQDDFQADFVTRHENDLRSCIMSIEGISCSACSWLIEKRLLQLDGVNQATVNIGTHRLDIRWDNSKVTLSELVHSLVLIGYKASPFLPSQEEKIIQKTQRQYIFRLGIAGIGMMQAMMNAVALYSGTITSQHVRWLWWTGLFLTIPVILISARPFIVAAWHAIRQKQLTMDVSVSIAILSAFIASCLATFSGQGEVYFESVNMFTFFLVLSRFLEFRARTHSSRKGNQIRQFLPQTCTRLDDQGSSEVSVKELRGGDIIQLMPGEMCPIDGVILNGHTEFDESSFTGEFAGIEKKTGDTVFAGTTNRNQKVQITVNSHDAVNSFNLLQQLIERSSSEKPRLAQMADRGARQFIWSTLIIALLIGLVWYWIDPGRAFWIVISVLVVTCPCALSLATPTALARATLTLKETGLIVTRGYVLERLATLESIAFDKTGTLTEGRFALQSIDLAPDSPLCLTKKEACWLSAVMESYSEHSIGQAFTVDSGFTSQIELTDIANHSGSGLTAQSSHGQWKLGSAAFTGCQQHKDSQSTDIHLTLNNQRVATFHLSDPIRSTVENTFASLAQLNVGSHILTGDPNPEAEHLFRARGLSGDYQRALTPEGKVNWVQQQPDNMAVVGDGLNDAPVLARANLSIAMMDATDLTKSQADALLLTNHLPTLANAIRLARKTNQIIRQNLAWALVYNAIALPVAAAGLVAPWQAAIGMSVSSLLVVGNAMRLKR